MKIYHVRYPETPIFESRDHRYDLRDRDLMSAQFSELDLDEADFSNCRLGPSHFNRSRLHEAKFDWAKMSLARFCDADLHMASFRGATLSGVDFSGANLRGVNFDGAHLERVRFTNADLSQTSFIGAFVMPTSLAGTRVDGAEFLDTRFDFSISGIAGSGSNNYIRYGHFFGAVVAYTHSEICISLTNKSARVRTSIENLWRWKPTEASEKSDHLRRFGEWWMKNRFKVLELILAAPAKPCRGEDLFDSNCTDPDSLNTVTLTQEKQAASFTPPPEYATNAQPKQSP